MKVLLAPNSMKGSLNAFDFADQMAAAFAKISDLFEIKKLPVADGGDFTAEILIRALGFEVKSAIVQDALARPVKAQFGIKEQLAVIEMANASGMKLLNKDELAPMIASSYGTGQLIVEAIRNGANQIWIGVGGSATVDGGMGMLSALGFQFFDTQKNLLTGNGENLLKIQKIDSSECIVPNNIQLKFICDVDNPLTGRNGAAKVFSPQKGANPKMVQKLENGLKHFARLLEKKSGIQIEHIPGTGAAGGISAGANALLNAEIVEGAEFILNKIDFDTWAKWADIIITGEGKLDEQTMNNKAPFVVAKHGEKYNKPVYAVCGINNLKCNEVFKDIFPITDERYDTNYSIKNAGKMVYSKTLHLAESLLK